MSSINHHGTNTNCSTYHTFCVEEGETPKFAQVKQPDFSNIILSIHNIMESYRFYSDRTLGVRDSCLAFKWKFPKGLHSIALVLMS